MLRCIVAFLAIAGSSMGFAPPGAMPALRGVRPAVCGVHMGKTAADGLFTPLVNAVKAVLGDKTLNKIRGDVIAKHSAVISAFCDTNGSAFGKIALKQLYQLADKDSNGKLDKDELKEALTKLGFTHLGDAAIEGIFARADQDGNAEIDFEEFMNEAPKTLRTNLVKLAKTNGNDLGFLS